MRDVIVTFNLSRVVMSPYSRYVMTGKWSAPTREEWRSVPADLNDQDVPGWLSNAAGLTVLRWRYAEPADYPASWLDSGLKTH